MGRAGGVPPEWTSILSTAAQTCGAGPRDERVALESVGRIGLSRAPHVEFDSLLGPGAAPIDRALECLRRVAKETGSPPVSARAQERESICGAFREFCTLPTRPASVARVRHRSGPKVCALPRASSAPCPAWRRARPVSRRASCASPTRVTGTLSSTTCPARRVPSRATYPRFRLVLPPPRADLATGRGRRPRPARDVQNRRGRAPGPESAPVPQPRNTRAPWRALGKGAVRRGRLVKTARVRCEAREKTATSAPVSEPRATLVPRAPDWATLATSPVAPLNVKRWALATGCEIAPTRSRWPGKRDRSLPKFALCVCFCHPPWGPS